MSAWPPDKNRDNEIERHAARLVIQLDSGASPAERNLAYQWINADPRHAVAFAIAQDAWEKSARLRLRAGEESGDNLQNNEDVVERPNFTRRQVAAAILAVGALGTSLRFLRSSDRHSTRHGERAVTRLPDNSSIAMNSETVLDVALNERARLVRLEKGEALFDITRDEKRPFVVDLGGAKIEVLGTKFNVRRNPDFVELTVLEGLVVVSSRPGEQLKVPAGFAAIIRPGLTASAIRDPALVRQRASWVDGFLQFDNEPLEKVVEEFNRYRKTPLLIGDPRIRSTLIAGRFGINEGDDFVQALESSFDIRADRRSDGTILLMGDRSQ